MDAASSRVTAWGNRTWVMAVMHYPDEPVLLDRVARGLEFTLRPEVEHKMQLEAEQAGKVAGNVLMVLFAVEHAGWDLPCVPSLALAYHCAERLEFADREVHAAARGRGRSWPSRPGPRGHTKIEAAYNRMRSVAHLWAATRLYWEFSARPYEEMPRSPQNLRALLGIARAVQEWAREWEPPRTPKYKPLLGADPWLVTADIAALHPPWPSQPPALLSKAFATYKRRKR